MELPETEITIRFVRKDHPLGDGMLDERIIHVDEFLFHNIPMQIVYPFFWQMKAALSQMVRDNKKSKNAMMGGKIYTNEKTKIEDLNEFLQTIEKAFEKRRLAGYEKCQQKNKTIQ